MAHHHSIRVLHDDYLLAEVVASAWGGWGSPAPACPRSEAEGAYAFGTGDGALLIHWGRSDFFFRRDGAWRYGCSFPVPRHALAAVRYVRRGLRAVTCPDFEPCADGPDV